MDMMPPSIQELTERTFTHCGITEVANGWIIERRMAPAIVIEKVPDRDNVAHLLAQLSVLLGDDQSQ